MKAEIVDLKVTNQVIKVEVTHLQNRPFYLEKGKAQVKDSDKELETIPEEEQLVLNLLKQLSFFVVVPPNNPSFSVSFFPPDC